MNLIIFNILIEEVFVLWINLLLLYMNLEESNFHVLYNNLLLKKFFLNNTDHMISVLIYFTTNETCFNETV